MSLPSRIQCVASSCCRCRDYKFRKSELPVHIHVVRDLGKCSPDIGQTKHIASRSPYVRFCCDTSAGHADLYLAYIQHLLPVLTPIHCAQVPVRWKDCYQSYLWILSFIASISIWHSPHMYYYITPTPSACADADESAAWLLRRHPPRWNQFVPRHRHRHFYHPALPRSSSQPPVLSP